jgi:hypothetical protein
MDVFWRQHHRNNVHCQQEKTVGIRGTRVRRPAWKTGRNRGSELPAQESGKVVLLQVTHLDAGIDLILGVFQDAF